MSLPYHFFFLRVSRLGHRSLRVEIWFFMYKNTAFSLNYSTDISLRCCKVSRVLKLCSTALLIIEISEFNRLIAWLVSFKVYESCQGFSSVQSLSRVQLFVIPWIAGHQASLSIASSRSSLRLTTIESVMPSSHLILCRPLLLLPPIPPSIRVFFPMRQLFAWGGQSTGVSVSASFLPKKSQGWSPLEWSITSSNPIEGTRTY